MLGKSPGFGAVAIALLASDLPARRAARVDPLVAPRMSELHPTTLSASLGTGFAGR